MASTWISYDGATINGASLPARRTVPVTVVDDFPFPAADVTIRQTGQAVGRLPASAPDGARHAATALLDLSATPLGPVTGRFRVRSSAVDKSFTLVPDPLPGPSNTGFRGAEVDLDPHPGGWFTTDTTLYGRLITGPIVAKADVTLVDCLQRTGEVVGGRTVNVDSAAGGSFTAERTTFDGMRQSVLGLGYNRLTLAGCDVFGFSDGMRLNTDCWVENSWVHDLARQGDLHPDCIQSTGGRRITVAHSTLDCTGRKADGSFDLGNACVMLGNENLARNPASVLEDVTVEDCWLNGGNYTLQVRDDEAMARIAFRGNRFGRERRYGYIARFGTQPLDVDCTGNVDADGTPVTARQL